MKKLIAIFLVLVSLNAKSQDTSYFLKGNNLYQKVITTEMVKDTSSWAKYTLKKEKSRRRNRRENVAAFGIFILSIALIWKP
jgi:hypothetical protein